MRCEHNFCIYCDNDKCQLKEIWIDSLGMCSNCIEINIEDETLKELKKELLDIYALNE